MRDHYSETDPSDVYDSEAENSEAENSKGKPLIKIEEFRDGSTPLRDDAPGWPLESSQSFLQPDCSRGNPISPGFNLDYITQQSLERENQRENLPHRTRASSPALSQDLTPSANNTSDDQITTDKLDSGASIWSIYLPLKSVSGYFTSGGDKPDANSVRLASAEENSPWWHFSWIATIFIPVFLLETLLSHSSKGGLVSIRSFCPFVLLC